MGAATVRDLRWLAHRLRVMEPREVVLRAWRLVRDRAWQARHPWPIAWVGSRDDRPLPATPDSPPALADPPSGAELETLLATADRLLAGEEIVMGWGWRDVGSPPAWRRDPVSGLAAAAGYGPALDYRDRTRFAEVRRTWELSRHHRWVTLAWAWAATGRGLYLDAIAAEALDWCRANPYPDGPNWTSALEVALRLVSWSHVRRIAGRALDARVEAALTRGAELSVHYLQAHRSVGSSANNHALGEALGLVVAADAWPWLGQADDARDLGWRLLARDAPPLIGREGWPLEQSVGYGVFTLDLLLEALLSPSATRRPEAAVVRDSARALAAALHQVDGLGEPPDIGDNDDGKVLPAPDPPTRWDAVLSVAVPWLLGVARPPRTAWGAMLLRCGRPVAPVPEEVPSLAESSAAVHAFSDGGVVVLRGGRLAALMDVGPLGHGALAAHGHADALQILLWVDGRAVLVDPGMPCYFEDPARRDAYRGTAVHNTVCVDGQDQSEMRGPFLWGRRAHVTAPEWGTDGAIPWASGAHDGYARPPLPTTHRRRAVLHAGELAVHDELASAAPRRFTLTWQLHPECQAHPDGSAWVVERGPSRLRLTFEGDVLGSRVESFGVSASFGAVSPAPRVVAWGLGGRWLSRFRLL